MQVFDFFLIALAAFYAATILADDLKAGPFNILTKIRSLAGLTYDDYGHPQVTPGSFAELFTCVYCNSIWIGLIFTAVYVALLGFGIDPTWFFAPLSAAGFVILVKELSD